MCHLTFQTFFVHLLSALMNFNGNMIYRISITQVLLHVNSILLTFIGHASHYCDSVHAQTSRPRVKFFSLYTMLHPEFIRGHQLLLVADDKIPYSQTILHLRVTLHRKLNIFVKFLSSIHLRNTTPDLKDVGIH
jgi:hypothetical protein